MTEAIDAESAAKDPLLVVEAGECRLAIPLRQVQEILVPRPMSRIFRAPAAVRGVTNLRGEILPVLELRILLELSSSAHHPVEPRIVVLRASAEVRQRVGLWVDAVGDVAPHAEELDRPPATIAEGIRAFVRGVLPGPPIAAVLDVERLLRAPAIVSLADRR